MPRKYFAKECPLRSRINNPRRKTNLMIDFSENPTRNIDVISTATEKRKIKPNVCIEVNFFMFFKVIKSVRLVPILIRCLRAVNVSFNPSAAAQHCDLMIKM